MEALLEQGEIGMTPRELLLAFKDGTLSKHEVRERLRALQMPPRKHPLSEGQQGLWALQKMAPEMSAYNVPLCFRLGHELDVALLQRACGLLLERFPILTTVFGEEDGVPFQTEQPSQLLCFEQEDISRLESGAVLPHLRARASQPFSLDAGPCNAGPPVHPRHGGRRGTSAPHHRAPHHL